MGIKRYFIGCLYTIILSMGVYSQEILIDGTTKSLSGFSCGEKHTLLLSDPSTWALNLPSPYCLWQRSDNDGASWQNILESGTKVYSIDVVNYDGTKQLYRTIIADSESDATNFALSGVATGQSVLLTDEVTLQCDLPICGKEDNRLVVWMEDFKSVPRGERRECDNLVGLKFAGKYNTSSSTNIGDGKYGVVSHSSDGSIPNYNWFSGGTDHTGNKDGGFLIINNVDGGAPDVLLYEKKIDFDLCPNTWYYFSLYAMCISGGAIGDSDDSFAHCNFTFEIIGEDGVTVLALDKSGDVPLSNYGISSWYNYGVSFNSSNNKNVILRIYDSAKKNLWGNDMAVDDISLIACQKVVPETTLGVGLEKDKEGTCGDVTQLSLSDMSWWENELPNVYCTWQTSDDGGFTWTIMPESGEKVYSIEVPFQKSVEGIRYRVIISKDQASGEFIAEHGYSDDACSIYKISNVSTLTCHCETPVLSVAPANPSFCTDYVTLSATVENAAPVDSFVWSYQDIDTGDWITITDQKGASISVFSQTDMRYCVVAWNDTCHSDTLFITVPVKSPDIMKVNIDGAQTICENGSVTLKLAGITENNITWKKMEEGESDFSDISGADTPAIEVSPKKKTSYCAVSDILPGQCVQVFSDTVTVAVEDSVRFTMDASANAICAGSNFSLKISPSQSSLTYVWEAKGDDEASFSAITPTTATELNLQPTQSTTYQVTGKTSVCPDVSHSFHVVVDNTATLSLTSSTDVVCVNGEVSLTADYGTATAIVWEQKMESEADFTEFATDLATQKTIHPAGKTSYRIRSTQGGECPESVSDIITIDTEDSLKVSIAAIEPVVCNGTNVSLQATVSGTPESVKWEKTVGGQTSLLANALTANDVPTQASEYTVTASGKYCPSVSQSVSVAVDTKAVLTLNTSANEVCVNGEVILTADYGTATAIVWEQKTESEADFTEFATDLATQKTIHPAGKTSYRIRSTQGGECPESVSDIITIDTEDSLKVSIAAIEPVVCNGTNVSLQATVSGTPESVKWEKTVGGQTSLLANALTANDVPTQASEYTVTASGKYCPSVSQSVSVAVDTKAVLTLNTSANEVCVNGEVILTADYGTATAIVWEQKTESEADFTEFATDLATQKAIHPAGKTSYRIRSTQGGACPESVSDIITIDTEDSLRMDLQPIAEQIKEGESVTLKATITTGTPTSFTWEKESSSNKSTLSTNYETTDTPSENCTYIATVHAKHCPDVSKSQSILFKPQIILSLTSVVDTICEGEEVILTASYGEAENIVWEMQEDGETNYADFATDLTTQKSINPIVTTHYRIRTTGDDAVYSNVVTIHVEKPVEIELTGDESVCKGSDYTINFHVTNGQDLSSLILYETVNSKTIKQENIEIFNLNDYNGSYHYTLKEETSFNLKAIPNHCYEVETTHIVKIDTVPTLYELTASVDSICRGEYVDISTDFPFSEDNLLLTALTIRTNEQEESYMISTKERLNPNETTYYTLTPRTEKGCIGEKKGITIYVSEPIEITTKDTTVCTGEKAVLHVDKESSKEQYIWSTSPEFTDTIATSNNQMVHPEETTTYYVKAINGKCEKELEQTVYIAPRPSILVSQEEARTIHLEGVGGTGDYWYDYGSGYEQTNEIAHAVPNKTYTIKIKDEAGCINDTTFTVQPYDLIIPEYFTPQSDGCNDTWKIINLNKYTRVNVTIYDRYGKILFEAKTPDQEWDGTYNGYALPSEDYWYVVKVYDIGAIYSGHFTLIR